MPVKKLMKSMIHGDSSPSNFIVKNGNITGIIDFGTMRYDYMLSEAALFLLRSHIYTIEDRAKYLSFIKAYLATSKIDKNEIKWLHIFVKAAISYGLISSYKEGNKKKLAEYKGKLKLLEAGKSDLFKL